MTDLAALALGIALIYGAGVATGWTLARRSTRYMLGGNYSLAARSIATTTVRWRDTETTTVTPPER